MLPGLGTCEWYIPMEHSWKMRVRMTYSDPLQKIYDLDIHSVANSTGTQSQRQILDSLQKFHNLNARFWKSCFDKLRKDLITLCTKFQEEIVIKIGPSAKIPEEALLIAHCLRIMALAHNVFEIEILWVIRENLENFLLSRTTPLDPMF